MKFYVLPFAMIALLLFGGCSNSDPDAPGTVAAGAGAPGVTFITDCKPFPGTQACGELCIDTSADALNCGGCGKVCSAGQSCNDGVCSTCAKGVAECASGCAILSSDNNNCGMCGKACGAGALCMGGVCSCAPGDLSCGGACVAANDPKNCGQCGVDCVALGQVCSATGCSATCEGTATNCEGSCADLQTDARNCGACGMACAPGQACSAGACACPVAGQLACGGACVDTQTNPLNCGNCGVACASTEACMGGVCNVVMSGGGGASGAGGASGTGGAGPVTPDGCVVDPGMIANFEGGSDKVIAQEGRVGAVEQYNDGAGTQTTVIETEGTDKCNQGVLHTTGSGFNVWGAGVGTVLNGTLDTTKMPKPEYIPTAYDASKYTAVSFRAKKGPGQQNPVRFSISTPDTEGPPHGNGSCIQSEELGVPNPCWSHLGHFLLDDEELSTQWQTYTFCFDRDYYPMFLLSHVPMEVRRAPNKALLKIQFQFNQSFDQKTAKQVPITGGIDFYLDDLRFTNPASCEGEIFKSTGGAKQPFGSNKPIGSCAPVPDAAKFNAAISQAYARWKKLFLRADGGVMDPDKSWVVSEGIGYGMILTAAMGDKEAFDKIWGWAKPKMGGGLLGWRDGSGGSASDGDTDMAFGLLMAGAQWGGSFAADGKALAEQAKAKDVVGNLVRGGEDFKQVFNPSYFSPGFYRKFGGWDGIIDAMYSAVGRCAASFGGLVPDWCDPIRLVAISAMETNAAVQAAEVCDSSTPCLAFESARTPWRIGYDLCFDKQGSSLLTGFLSALKSGDPRIENGKRIDAVIAGWAGGKPLLTTGVKNAMAFIGPLGVAGMGLGDEVLRDRAFRATLDIIERPEFYKTYYQNSLGLLALLTMSGNFPTPP